MFLVLLISANVSPYLTVTVTVITLVKKNVPLDIATLSSMHV